MTSTAPQVAKSATISGRRAGVSQLAAVAAIAAADEHGQITSALRRKPVQETRYWTISDIERANSRAGYFFFSPDTLRFFSSRVSSTVYGHGVFVTSEKGPFDDSPRLYSVRLALPTGDVVTLDGFQSFTTSRAAHTAADRLGKVWAPIADAYWAPYERAQRSREDSRRAAAQN